MIDENKIIVCDKSALNEVHLYFIGDKHVGSPCCVLSRIRKSVQDILADPAGHAVICGDLMDMGIKTAKTNTYFQTMMPEQQKETVFELFKPLADAGKILAAVPGNHCRRNEIAVGMNPLYDICCRWHIEDVYRKHYAVVKIQVGSKTKNGKPATYVGVIDHGSSRATHHRWATGWDGVDFFVSGHTHRPGYDPHGKLRVDPRNNTITHLSYKEIVVDAGLDYGDYAADKNYEISPPAEMQMLTLCGARKKMIFTSEDIAC